MERTQKSEDSGFPRAILIEWSHTFQSEQNGCQYPYNNHFHAEVLHFHAARHFDLFRTFHFVPHVASHRVVFVVVYCCCCCGMQFGVAPPCGASPLLSHRQVSVGDWAEVHQRNEASSNRQH